MAPPLQSIEAIVAGVPRTPFAAFVKAQQTSIAKGTQTKQLDKHQILLFELWNHLPQRFHIRRMIPYISHNISWCGSP